MALLQSALDELYLFWSFINGASFSKIRLSENHTFLVSLGDQKWILRLTPDHHKQYNQIESELNFILCLGEAEDLNTCPPIKGDNGNYICSVAPYNSDEKWWAVLFTHAQGVSCENFTAFTNPYLIEEWGRVVGRMHKKISSLGWQVDENTPERWKIALRSTPQYYETHSGALTEERIEELAAESETGKLVAERWKMIKEKLRNYPKLNSNYGIIHGDLTMGNYFGEFDENNKPIRLWVFDFDQSQFNWLAVDIAVAFYFARFLGTHGWCGVKIEGLVIEEFEKIFLKGYTAEYQGMSLEDLELFNDLRELYNVSISIDAMHKLKLGTQFFDPDIVTFVNHLIASFPLKK